MNDGAQIRRSKGNWGVTAAHWTLRILKGGRPRGAAVESVMLFYVKKCINEEKTSVEEVKGGKEKSRKLTNWALLPKSEK